MALRVNEGLTEVGALGTIDCCGCYLIYFLNSHSSRTTSSFLVSMRSKIHLVSAQHQHPNASPSSLLVELDCKRYMTFRFDTVELGINPSNLFNYHTAAASSLFLSL